RPAAGRHLPGARLLGPPGLAGPGAGPVARRRRLRLGLLGVQGGAGLPFRNPPSVRDVWGAFGASLRDWGRRPWSREDGLIRSGGARSYPPSLSSDLVRPLSAGGLALGLAGRSGLDERLPASFQHLGIRHLSPRPGRRRPRPGPAPRRRAVGQRAAEALPQPRERPGRAAQVAAGLAPFRPRQP